MKFPLILGLLLTTSIFSLFAQTEEQVNYSVTFTVGNMGGSVEGSFSDLSGTVSFDPANPQAAVFEVSVDATTIKTGVGMRDRHLRGKDFFAVKDFPSIRFTATETRTTDTGFETIGTLTLKGQDSTITIPFTVEEVAGKKVIQGSFSVDRKAFGIGKGYGNWMIGEAVTIQLRYQIGEASY
ncbi:MAG: YceI family protein [Bacteroidota bacterium]